nr:hypothetical protein [uncultured Pedobacter sp.]
MKNLKTISFSIDIDTNRERIWNALWNPITYVQWCSVFAEGSYYTGSIRQGNTIQFLRKDGRGMSSYIEKLIENEQIVFAHEKDIKDGVETDSNWQGAKEIFYLKKESDNATELQVILDITPDMEAYFTNVFPKALNMVKQIAEKDFI